MKKTSHEAAVFKVVNLNKFTLKWVDFYCETDDCKTAEVKGFTEIFFDKNKKLCRTNRSVKLKNLTRQHFAEKLWEVFTDRFDFEVKKT